MMNTRISQELESQNPWYLEDQLQCSEDKSQKKIISERKEYLKRTISEHIAQNINPAILDAGCGDGVNLKYLCDIQHASFYGLEYNPIRIARAKEYVPTAHIVLGDLLNIPFKNDCVDIILLNHVLEHIHEDLEVLKELNRILKPDGILIIGVPNEGCFIALLRNNIVQREIKRTTDHVQQYTETTIRKKLIKAGWRIKSMRREGFFLPHMIMNTILARSDIGFKIIKSLCKSMKSQCGGFHFVCEKE